MKMFFLALLAISYFSYVFGAAIMRNTNPQRTEVEPVPEWDRTVCPVPDTTVTGRFRRTKIIPKDISCTYYQKKFAQREHRCSIRVRPVCATNNVTYPNSCVYCFAKVALNLDLDLQYYGVCEKPRFLKMV